MRFFKNPGWSKNFEYPYKGFSDIPREIFDDINKGLDKIQSGAPLASIVITAFNEEVDILRTVGSLSKLKTKFPLEIIVVNNNSTDRTQEKSFF